MSETISIKNVIDDWYSLGLSKLYVHDSNRVLLSLQLIFANYGLKIVSGIPDKLRLRYNQIVKKVKNNKNNLKKPLYYGFSLDDIFYSATEFPGLCANETPVPKR